MHLSWVHRVFIVISLIFLFLSAMLVQVQFSFDDQIYSSSSVPFMPIGIILGAGLKPNGTPSEALTDRLKMGVKLYHEGKVKKLLLTGDDGEFHVNEIAVMKPFLEKFGVPSEDILSDGHGYRTYESCRRAKQIYHIDRATIVTQRFHLTRALFLCERLGIRSYGVRADNDHTRIPIKGLVRDVFASIKAFNDIYLFKPVSPVPALANEVDPSNESSFMKQ